MRIEKLSCLGEKKVEKCQRRAILEHFLGFRTECDKQGVSEEVIPCYYYYANGWLHEFFIALAVTIQILFFYEFYTAINEILCYSKA